MIERDKSEPLPHKGWNINIDFADIIGAAGLVIATAGALMINIGFALFVAGGALCAIAWRISRRG